VVVSGVLVAGGTIGPRETGRPAAEVTGSRLTGSWVRVLAAEEAPTGDATGAWTMVLGADGAVTLVPPVAWSTEHFQPTGVYLRAGDGLRTNVFASEACAGSAGAYSFTVDHATLDLSASLDPCPLRVAVLDGRWERSP
jgi:hypothetical protein